MDVQDINTGLKLRNIQLKPFTATFGCQHQFLSAVKKPDRKGPIFIHSCAIVMDTICTTKLRIYGHDISIIGDAQQIIRGIGRDHKGGRACAWFKHMDAYGPAGSTTTVGTKAVDRGKARCICPEGDAAAVLADDGKPGTD